MYLLVLMLCTVGTDAMDLRQPLLVWLNNISGIDAVYFVVLMLCTVGPHAGHLWQPFVFVIETFVSRMMLCTCWY